MALFASTRLERQRRSYRFASATALLGALLATADAWGKDEILRIGSSGNLTGASKEKGALDTLRTFIKDETGMEDEIVRQKDWRELAAKMAKGDFKIGVFQGYEFAWAQEHHPDLKPLALAINVYRYPVAYVVTARGNKAKDFAGLQGQSLYVPDTGQPYLRLYIERASQAHDKDMKTFFSKLPTAPTVEDGLDDVVDGIVQAAVVDRASLEAYKRRKPARFAKLKQVAMSQPMPPVVIAYYGKHLDGESLQKFRKGLLGAGKSEKGRMMLTLFHLSNFDPVPDDFGKVVASTRKAYPPPK